MFKLNPIYSEYSMDEIRTMLNSSYDRKEMTWVEKLWTGTKLTWHPNKTTFYLKKWSIGMFRQDAPVRIRGKMEPYQDKTKVSLSAASPMGIAEYLLIGIPSFLIFWYYGSGYGHPLAIVLTAALIVTAIWLAFWAASFTVFSVTHFADNTREDMLLKLEILLEQKKKNQKK